MKLKDHFNDLVNELDRYYLDDTNRPDFPNFVTSRNGYTCEYTSKAIQSSELIANIIHLNSKKISSSIEIENFTKVVRQCIADFYTEEKFKDFQKDSTKIISSFKEHIDDEVKKTSNEYTHYFPAWTLGMEREKPFIIGPVTIMTKEEWIDSVNFPEEELKRNLDVFSQNQNWKESLKARLKKEEKLTSPFYNLTNSIYNAIEKSPSILKITIDNFERDLSRKLANLICKTALDSISLLCGNSRFFHQQFLSDDRALPVVKYGIIETNGHIWRPGFSATERMSIIDGSKAYNLLIKNKDMVEAFESVLLALLAPQDHAHPKLSSRWATALNWYSEGNRDQNDAIAITKIATALDVLSNGGKFKGILTMLMNLFNISEDKEVFNIGSDDAITLKQFTKDIYDSSRSKILHGTHHERLKSFLKQKEQANHIARLALLHTALELKNYNGEDQDKGFNSILINA